VARFYLFTIDVKNVKYSKLNFVTDFILKQKPISWIELDFISELGILYVVWNILFGGSFCMVWQIGWIDLTEFMNTAITFFSLEKTVTTLYFSPRQQAEGIKDAYCLTCASAYLRTR